MESVEIMKSKLLVTMGVLLSFSTGFSGTDEFKVLETETKGVKIQIHPKLELFHIMAYLSHSESLNNLNFKYKSEIDSFFSSYKNDSSVRFVKKVLENYHASLSINQLFFDRNFKNDSSFMRFLDLDNFGLANTLTNKATVMDSLMDAVDSFSKISQFDRFFERHQIYYQQKINEVARTISDMNLIRDLESFWGTEKDNTIIVITILGQDIHASWFSDNSESYSIFYLSPKFVIDNDATFGNSSITDLSEGKMAAEDAIYYGAMHEFGHAFLNPIMDHYSHKIDKIPFSITTSDPTKTLFLCESFLRSQTAFFLKKNHQVEFAQMVIQGEKQQGYIYNEIILELIDDYSNHRETYRDFNSFAVEFLEKLEKRIAPEISCLMRAIHGNGSAGSAGG